MVMKYCSSDNCGFQRWDDIHFPQFESCGSDLTSQSCQVILVSVCNFLNLPMFSQSLEQPRDLMSALAVLILVRQIPQLIRILLHIIQFLGRMLTKGQVKVVGLILPMVAKKRLGGRSVAIAETTCRLIIRPDRTVRITNGPTIRSKVLDI